MYEMNRKAFAILVMGFIGEKALKFKQDFVEAFDAIEAEFFKPKIPEGLPDFTNPAITARAWAD